MTPISILSADTLHPWLMKLRKMFSPESCLSVKWGWLSQAERESVRKSLTKINRRRSAAGEPKTDQPPK